jgi:hypothetical protein
MAVYLRSLWNSRYGYAVLAKLWELMAPRRERVDFS